MAKSSPNYFGKFVIALIVICFVAFAIGSFFFGQGATARQLFVFSVIAAFAAGLIFFVLFQGSTATAGGSVDGVKFATAGAISALIITFLLLKWNIPPPEYKSIQFAIVQGNSTYRSHCEIEFQFPSANNRTEPVENGRATITGVPSNASTVLIWSVKAFGNFYTPVGKTGSPPWKFDIGPNDTITIQLAETQSKACRPHQSNELKAFLVKGGWLDKASTKVEQSKQEQERRDELRQKALLKFENKTGKAASIIGIDCKWIDQQPNSLDLEDVEWLDFVEFGDTNRSEEVPFNNLKAMKKSTGVFCLYACVAVPDGKEAIYLGIFDLLEHETTTFDLEPNGEKGKPVTLKQRK